MTDCRDRMQHLGRRALQEPQKLAITPGSRTAECHKPVGIVPVKVEEKDLDAEREQKQAEIDVQRAKAAARAAATARMVRAEKLAPHQQLDTAKARARAAKDFAAEVERRNAESLKPRRAKVPATVMQMPEQQQPESRTIKPPLVERHIQAAAAVSGVHQVPCKQLQAEEAEAAPQQAPADSMDMLLICTADSSDAQSNHGLAQGAADEPAVVAADNSGAVPTSNMCFAAWVNHHGEALQAVALTGRCSSSQLHQQMQQLPSSGPEAALQQISAQLPTASVASAVEVVATDAAASAAVYTAKTPDCICSSAAEAVEAVEATEAQQVPAAAVDDAARISCITTSSQGRSRLLAYAQAGGASVKPGLAISNHHHHQQQQQQQQQQDPYSVSSVLEVNHSASHTAKLSLHKRDAGAATTAACSSNMPNSCEAAAGCRAKAENMHPFAAAAAAAAAGAAARPRWSPVPPVTQLVKPLVVKAAVPSHTIKAQPLVQPLPQQSQNHQQKAVHARPPWQGMKDSSSHLTKQLTAGSKRSPGSLSAQHASSSSANSKLSLRKVKNAVAGTSSNASIVDVNAGDFAAVLTQLGVQVQQQGVHLPALCSCGHCTCPLDPAYSSNCCSNCPLHNNMGAWRGLLVGLLESMGLKCPAEN